MSWVKCENCHAGIISWQGKIAILKQPPQTVFWNGHLFGKLKSTSGTATGLEIRCFSFPVMRTKGSGHQEKKPIHPSAKESKRCCNFSRSQVIPENVMYDFSQMGWARGVSPWSLPNQGFSSRKQLFFPPSCLGAVGEAVPLLRVNWSILNFANQPRERKGEGWGSRAGGAVTQVPVPSPPGFDWGQTQTFRGP